MRARRCYFSHCEVGQPPIDRNALMTTWNPRANELFLQAMEMASPADRQQFLDAACAAAPALRADVESLLQAAARAGRFLEAPALSASATVDEPRLAEQPGTVIGPYKLLE